MEFSSRFARLFEDETWNGDRSVFQEFLEFIDSVVLGPIKVSIIGYGGVGKTTLLRLIAGKEVNLEYVPTITADIANYNDFLESTKRPVVFWDFAGQIQFTSLWQGLLKGTKLAVLVTDSTFTNVKQSKKILEDLLLKYYKDARVIAIANKQDLDNRLTPEFVQKILEVPTFGMISIDSDYRAKIHEILRKEINEVFAQE